MAEVTGSTLLVGFVCALGGLVVGALLTYRFSAQAEQRRKLAEALQRKEEEASRYQQDVTAHFIKTAALVNDLAQSYRAFHHHVTVGAMTLATPEVGRQLLNATAGQLEFHLDQDANGGGIVEPPKDYSPRNGVLSARYGMNVGTGVGAEAAGTEALSADSRDDPTLKVG